MRRYRNNNFSNLSSVMGKVVKNLGLEKGLKLTAFAKVWPKIIGPRFSEYSRAVSLTEKYGIDILTVAVSSPSVAQELSFHKRDIIKRCFKVGHKFGFNIKEVVFNQKIWEEIQEKEKSFNTHIKLEKNFTEKEINNIKIPENIINSLKNSMGELENFDEGMKDKFLNTIVRDLKIQLWQKTNGFPSCQKCGIIMNSFNTDGTNFCPSCKYTD